MGFNNSTDCFCLQTRKAAFSIKEFYDKMLAPAGVTVRQYSLLLNILRLGVCSVRELSDATGLDRSTLARSLKPLFSGGYVVDTKERNCRDSRLRLTYKGESTLCKAAGLWRSAQEEIMSRFGSEGMQKFYSVLNMLNSL